MNKIGGESVKLKPMQQHIQALQNKTVLSLSIKITVLKQVLSSVMKSLNTWDRKLKTPVLPDWTLLLEQAVRCLTTNILTPNNVHHYPCGPT
jgi:hypothetical protein